MNLNIFILNIFIFLLGAQILRSFLGSHLRITNFIQIYKLRIIRFIFLFAIFVVFLLLFYQSYLQYEAWFSNEFSKHLLGQRVEFDNLNISVNYFIFYAITRFFAPYLISLISALIFLILAGKFNKKHDEKFFEREELWLGALALFLTSWPGAFFYFIGLILVYLIIHIILSLIYSFSPLRVSLYYLWMPTAIFVIIINKWLIELELWKLLKI